MSFRFAAPVLAFAIFGLAAAGPAQAQGDVMKECGKQYQAAKSANQLGGKSWNQYLADCRTRVSAQPAAAAPATPAATPAANPLKPAPAATTTAAPAARRQTGGGGARRQARGRRPAGDARPRARLRRGMEGEEGGPPEGQSADEMAEILERMQHAAEGRRPVAPTGNAPVSGAFRSQWM